MNKGWIQHPTILKGETIDLIPLEKKTLYYSIPDEEWKIAKNKIKLEIEEKKKSKPI